MQPAYRPQPGDIDRKLETLFPDVSDRRRAVEILERYGAESHHREIDRVRLATLRLAGGDLGALATQVESANIDYRDVLAAAEYPEFRLLPPGLDPSSDEYQRAVDSDYRQYLDWVNS